MPIHRSPKPGLIEFLLRQESIVACLEGIYSCGLPKEEIPLLLKAFEEDATGIVSANQLRRNGQGYNGLCDVRAAINCQYTTEEERQLWLTGIPPKTHNIPKQRRVGFVYLMLNRRNGFIKIGFSAKPKHREATLQSEEPEVHLLKTFPGDTFDEERIHHHFDGKRLRGEWFNLTNEDVAEVEGLMKKR